MMKQREMQEASLLQTELLRMVTMLSLILRALLTV